MFPDPPVGFQPQHVARFLKFSEEIHLAAFGDADAVQRFVVVQFDGGAVVIPYESISNSAMMFTPVKADFVVSKMYHHPGVGSLNAIRSLDPCAVE